MFTVFRNIWKENDKQTLERGEATVKSQPNQSEKTEEQEETEGILWGSW